MPWWPTEENVLSTYCDEEIFLVLKHYEKLLSQNGCNTEEIPPEWDFFKTHLELILMLHTKIDYLKVWNDNVIREHYNKNKNDVVKKECKNLLHAIELLGDCGEKSPSRFFRWLWHFMKEENFFVPVFLLKSSTLNCFSKCVHYFQSVLIS